MSRQSNFWPTVQRLLILVLFLLGLAFLGYEGLLYYQDRRLFPNGTTVAGVDVSGLTRQEAAEAINARYTAPLILQYDAEQVEIPPADVGFSLEMETMLDEAAQQQAEQPIWQGYLNFLADDLLDRSMTEPVSVALRADHDSAALRERVEMVAGYLDQPARPPQPVGDAMVFQPGKAGYITDLDASLARAESALYQPDGRLVDLVVVDEAEPPMSLEMLKHVLNNMLLDFDGMASLFILDLSSGEEMALNADVAVSGLSIVKIAILLETYRAIDNVPTVDQTKLISETAVLSGNYSANLLLDVVAGQDNAYLGSDILTESMQRLGLENTFIAVPYEEPARPGKATVLTPANTRSDVSTDPDPAMQTTAEDMGSLLAMIYYCTEGGGPLLAAYPEELTPGECQTILDVMKLNVDGNLIRYGVPDGVPVSHKHGWAGATHGDAGIVFSPGGDYVIVEYLHGEGGWLVADYSFPILRQISRVVYNFFNHEDPYLEERTPSAEPTPTPTPQPTPQAEAAVRP